MRRVALPLLLLACKSKQPPPPTPEPPPPPPPSVSAPAVTPSAKPRAAAPSGVVWGDIIVSSRVDNDKEEPAALMDGDPKTAWSSKTGELEGAWVALKLDHGVVKPTLHGLSMTIGLTRSQELFTQNPRIAEVKVTWNDKPLVERHAFDLESMELQKIPFELTEPKGVLKVTVTKVKLGSKPEWREVSISEMALADVKASSWRAFVGGYPAKPRGILNIIPEAPIEFGCYAAIPSAPVVYCTLGLATVQNDGTRAFVTIDRKGPLPIATTFLEQHVLPYGAWLRAERELKARGGKPLAKEDWKIIPWGKTLEVEGVTFRMRETQHAEAVEGLPENFNGELEVKWSGSDAFTTLFENAHMPATVAESKVQQVGPLWLVQRTMSHGSEGLYWSLGQAVLCDFTSKRCSKSLDLHAE